MKPKDKLSNYIPINRKLFTHPLWTEKRSYSKFEAWLDLVQAARFENTEATMLSAGKLVKWNRGELPVSLRFLAERWDWSKNKVDDFIRMLEQEKMIAKRTATGTSQTIISLCNYDSYNSAGKLSGQENGQRGDSEGTAGGQPGDETNKENNSKKGNNEGADAPPKQVGKLEEKRDAMTLREQQFYNELVPYVSVYGKDMVRAFFDYWREPNKSKTKMKFELEDTWDLRLRLIKWEKNQAKFNKGTAAAPPAPVNPINDALKQAGKQDGLKQPQ